MTLNDAVPGTDLFLQMQDGTLLAVPASLRATTSYVLLEQEAWFEKETKLLDRILQPGMTAIDIGANLGVYSLPMARRVGPEGRVFAYEPASETCRFLQNSRAINDTVRLEVLSVALSDSAREGRLVLGDSSELNALADSLAGPGESVRISSLDLEDAARGWNAPDFVKIDAEGEETRILAGGSDFFARYSPLVMFEVRSDAEIDLGLRDGLVDLGYGIYRQLAAEPILVPVNLDEPLDRYELNLFAAKPDRAAGLAERGALVREVPDWSWSSRSAVDRVQAEAMASFAGRAYASPFLEATLDPDYAEALLAYSAWRDTTAALPQRCAALAASLRIMRDLCDRAPSIARWSSLARVAWEAGERGLCVTVLQDIFKATILDAGSQSQKTLTEVFLPACPRFDALDPAGDLKTWFICGVVEQLELAKTFSSFFAGSSQNVTWLCQQPFVSAELERRRVLMAARDGENPAVPERLLQAAPDHVNAEVWRAGQVPGTRLST